MSGDWIKMRTDLYRDPRVCAMADHLIRGGNAEMGVSGDLARRIMRNAVVGALISVWGVMRHHSANDETEDDLVVAGYQIAVIDDISGIAGFGAAMASVSWVIQGEGWISFPQFFRYYNAEPKQTNEDRLGFSLN